LNIPGGGPTQFGRVLFLPQTRSCVKAKKILELRRSAIWLLLEQITRNFAFYFIGSSVICSTRFAMGMSKLWAGFWLTDRKVAAAQWTTQSLI
jgi:hypothetical protein